MSDLETKPFLAHLEDLRWTLIRSMGALAVGILVIAFSAKEVLHLLDLPLIWAGKQPQDFLVVMGVTDPFSIHVEISVFGGLILALPAILYFLGDFLLPALTPQEKRYLLPVFFAGTILFVSGVVFCYTFVLRVTLLFFLGYSAWLGQKPTWQAKDFYDFEVQMLMAFGLAAEMPLVILVLNLLGFVSSAMLASKRRHAAFGFFVMACCVIPSTDLFSLSTMAVPMYLLYEACIWVAYIAESRGKKKKLVAVVDND